MNFEEFIKPPSTDETPEEPEELDVQKAVVESLAADKAEQDEQIAALRRQVAALRQENENLRSARTAEESRATVLQKKMEDLRQTLAGYGDILLKNVESKASNQVTLLERDVEIDDHFPGETRDHVLEVIREARDAAESDGRVRRAQILEGVLVTNEPVGELEKKRKELERLFNENGNIVSGPVIERLNKMGISHKKGDDYLLPSEILKRNY